MSVDDTPTLTDPRGLGGIIAQDGFDFQLWYLLSRLPAWLATPNFEEVVLEALEDVEARFFVPHSKRVRLLERYQVKSGALSPAQVREVFEGFQRFELAFPCSARVQTLVTTGLPPTLRWLARDPGRVRSARPFYAPFADVAGASDAKLRADLQAEYGDALGECIAQAVEVVEAPIANRESAIATFSAALARAFPDLDVRQRAVEQAFEAIGGFIRQRRGTPVRHVELRRLAEKVLGQALPPIDPFPLHVRSDRNESNERALEIDASAFSGVNGAFPAAEYWRDGLLRPLQEAARWLRSIPVARISLSGSYRLTTALALGWSFRSATGFEIDIPTRDVPWATDDRPRTEEPYPPWCTVDAQVLDADCLHVSVGVLRDPTEVVLRAQGVPRAAILSLTTDRPITSGHASQAGVAHIKATVSATVARLRPSAIAVYFAGPAAFAVALGHRWNSLPATQLHEFRTAQGDYVKTALLDIPATQATCD